MSSSALFWLKENFDGYAEFRHFAASIESLVKRPLRKSLYISRDDPPLCDLEGNTNLKVPNVYPNNEESEMLWQLNREMGRDGRA